MKDNKKEVCLKIMNLILLQQEEKNDFNFDAKVDGGSITFTLSDNMKHQRNCAHQLLTSCFTNVSKAWLIEAVNNLIGIPY